jgi:hypothetical protein
MEEQRRKIKKIFIILISGLGVFSALMIFVAWYACSIAPRLMQQNYLSIQYAYKMESAFVSIYVAESGGKPLDKGEVALFDQNLSEAKENITEPGEAEILERLGTRWSNFKQKNMSPTLEEFQALLGVINELTGVNERGMYLLRDRAKQLGLSVVFVGVLGWALIMMYAAIIADGLLDKIALLRS